MTSWLADYDHPIFGKLSSSKAWDLPGDIKRYSFRNNVNRIVAKSANWEILKLNQNHPSVQCAMVSISSYDAIAFKSNQLRDVSFCLKEWRYVLHVCLIACPKNSFRKVTGCEVKNTSIYIQKQIYLSLNSLVVPAVYH